MHDVPPPRVSTPLTLLPRLRLVPALALLAASAGCMPAVTHGPRVEPGLQGGATASLPLGERNTEGDWGNQPFLYGPLGLSLGHGWTGEAPGRPAFFAGVHVPVPLVFFTQADLYAQAPVGALGPLDGGVGVNASAYHVAPYLQLGILDGEGSGWYTTQSVDFLLQRNSTYGNDLFGRLWIGTVAYQKRGRRHTTHYFVSAGAGRKYGGCIERCLRDEPRSVLAAGVTLTRHRARAAVE